LRNAEVARLLREEGKTFGFSYEKLSLDYKAAFERSRQVAKRLTQGVSFLMRKNNIEVFMGTAQLKSNQEVTVSLQDGKDTSLKAKNIIIATGAQTAAPPALAIDGNQVLSYLEAILLEQLPKSAVIIGAGAIGVEFATIWNSYGVDVTIVEMMPQLVPLEDEEIGAELSKAFTKRGIKVLTSTKVESLEKSTNSVKVNVSNAQGKQVIEAEKHWSLLALNPTAAI
jgi:dihydrolipoamide dehydrogenase